MCKILMSIHPEYVDQILQKNKKFEFRRTRPRRRPDHVVVYATAPVSKIVAEFKVKEIIELELDNLWDYTKWSAGIKKQDFMKYYKDKVSGYAYEIEEVIEYKIHKDLSDYGVLNAPQSFIYLD